MEQIEFCYRVREDIHGTWTVHEMFPPPTVGTKGWAKVFPSYEDLPYLIRQQIAALCLVDPKDGETIPHVGARHGSTPPTFWIYVSEAVV